MLAEGGRSLETVHSPFAEPKSNLCRANLGVELSERVRTKERRDAGDFGSHLRGRDDCRYRSEVDLGFGAVGLRSRLITRGNGKRRDAHNRTKTRPKRFHRDLFP
jgi:hypothetical protein